MKLGEITKLMPDFRPMKSKFKRTMVDLRNVDLEVIEEAPDEDESLSIRKKFSGPKFSRMLQKPSEQ